MTAKVLVTGGLGYLGGRISQALVHAGYAVTCGSRRTGVPSPGWLPTMPVVALDWNSQASLIEACGGMDAIVHLAAMNEIQAAKDPVGALRMNGMASTMLLEAAITAGVRRFVYFSTAHVYGAPLQGVIDEATLPRPQHPYAITHKVAEDFVLAAHDQKRIEGVVFRLSNGFGAPASLDVDRWTLLVNDLCRQAAVGARLKLNTAGTQLRDFVTLEDVSRAVVHAMRLETQQLADGLFNLGGDAAVSIFSMAQQVAARYLVLTGQDIGIERPLPSGPPPAPLTYSCEKFKATGFSLTSDVQREIDATLRICIDAFGNGD